MAGWNGAGVFVRLYNWVTDKANAIKITASRMDGEFDNYKTGLENCVTRDGQNSPSADLPMATRKHTNVGAATARTNYARVAEIQDGTHQELTNVAGTNTITADATPAITAYTAGQRFSFIAAGTNTGATTIDINSIGAAKAIEKLNAALVAGDITAGDVVLIEYDGTAFQMLSPARTPVFASGVVTPGVITTRGDLIYGNATPAAARLAVGAASTVLRSDGTDPSWGKVAGAHIAMGSDAQGDILYHNGTSYARLGAGTSGQFLKTQGAAANPVWASVLAASPTYTYNAAAQNSGDAAAQSFAAVSTGTANAERVVYIGGYADASAAAGFPRVLQIEVGDYVTSDVRMACFDGSPDSVAFWGWVRVPTGTSATVVVTFDRTTSRCGIVSYSVTNPENEVPISFTGTDVEPMVTPVRGVDGGVVMMVAGQTGANTVTFSGGVTEDLGETAIEGTVRYSAASAQLSADGTISPTATWTGSSTFPAGATIVVR